MVRDITISLLMCLVLLTATVGCAPVASSEAHGTAETDLEARLEAPTTLTTGEPMVVRFTLTNTTDTKLYVLTWYTPLEGIAGEIFRVERDGQVVPYEGILASRAAPSAEDYVLLHPGASASAEVDLATAYDVAQPGSYTIAFRSPSISHVARGESEMATSLDDLGPVQMPSNTVTVEVGTSQDWSDRLRPEEAEAMVLATLRDQKPDLSEDVPLAMVELPDPEVQAHLPVQVFRVTEGPFARETFLIDGDIVLRLGTAVGGQGVTSMRVSDLDGDGRAELLFTYSFGSGIHQSRIAMYAPAYAEDRIYQTKTSYRGDLGLLKVGMSDVRVRAVESDAETMTLRYVQTLGHLSIEHPGGKVELVLHLTPDLPEDVRQRLMDTTSGGEERTQPEWERYVNDVHGFAFRYPTTWALAEETNLVRLSQGTLLLTIAFQGQDEDAPLPWTGMPAGDLESRGTIRFLGHEMERDVLVYEGKVKVLTYGAEVRDLMFSIRVEDVETADYAAIELSEAVQSEAEQIVTSFEWTSS